MSDPSHKGLGTHFKEQAAQSHGMFSLGGIVLNAFKLRVVFKAFLAFTPSIRGTRDVLCLDSSERI